MYSVLVVRIADAPDERPVSDLTARARIRDAAIECFAEQGFGASFRTIAARADVSPGLITHHFGSKDALRAECDGEVLRRYEALKTGSLADPSAYLAKHLAEPGEAAAGRSVPDTPVGGASSVDEAGAGGGGEGGSAGGRTEGTRSGAGTRNGDRRGEGNSGEDFAGEDRDCEDRACEDRACEGRGIRNCCRGTEGGEAPSGTTFAGPGVPGDVTSGVDAEIRSTVDVGVASSRAGRGAGPGVGTAGVTGGVAHPRVDGTEVGTGDCAGRDGSTTTSALSARRASRVRSALPRSPHTRSRRDRRWPWPNEPSSRSSAANCVSSMATPLTPREMVQPSGSNGSGRPVGMAAAGRSTSPPGTTSATIDARDPPPATRYSRCPHCSQPGGAGATLMTSWTPPGTCRNSVPNGENSFAPRPSRTTVDRGPVFE